MNREQFFNYLNNPASLDSKSLIDLTQIVNEYPYFQTAHLLLIKNLHNQEDIKYNNQLKISSAYITDRKILFNLVYNKKVNDMMAAKNAPVIDEQINLGFSNKKEETPIVVETPVDTIIPDKSPIDSPIENKSENIVPEIITAETKPHDFENTPEVEIRFSEVPTEEVKYIEVKHEQTETSDSITESKDTLADVVFKKVRELQILKQKEIDERFASEQKTVDPSNNLQIAEEPIATENLTEANLQITNKEQIEESHNISDSSIHNEIQTSEEQNILTEIPVKIEAEHSSNIDIIRETKIENNTVIQEEIINSVDQASLEIKEEIHLNPEQTLIIPAEELLTITELPETISETPAIEEKPIEISDIKPERIADKILRELREKREKKDAIINSRKTIEEKPSLPEKIEIIAEQIPEKEEPLAISETQHVQHCIITEESLSEINDSHKNEELPEITTEVSQTLTDISITTEEETFAVTDHMIEPDTISYVQNVEPIILSEKITPKENISEKIADKILRQVRERREKINKADDNEKITSTIIDEEIKTETLGKIEQETLISEITIPVAIEEPIKEAEEKTIETKIISELSDQKTEVINIEIPELATTLNKPVFIPYEELKQEEPFVVTDKSDELFTEISLQDEVTPLPETENNMAELSDKTILSEEKTEPVSKNKFSTKDKEFIVNALKMDDLPIYDSLRFEKRKNLFQDSEKESIADKILKQVNKFKKEKLAEKFEKSIEKEPKIAAEYLPVENLTEDFTKPLNNSVEPDFFDETLIEITDLLDVEPLQPSIINDIIEPVITEETSAFTELPSMDEDEEIIIEEELILFEDEDISLEITPTIEEIPESITPLFEEILPINERFVDEILLNSIDESFLAEENLSLSKNESSSAIIQQTIDISNLQSTFTEIVNTQLNKLVDEKINQIQALKSKNIEILRQELEQEFNTLTTLNTNITDSITNDPLDFDFEEEIAGAKQTISVPETIVSGEPEELFEFEKSNFVDYFIPDKKDLSIKKPIPVIESTASKYSNLNSNLVDSFLRGDHKIVPTENTKNYKEISKQSIEESEECISETLAKIYFKQGHYHKSLLAYRKLSLKYPEKSIYFAGQIEKLKKLINE